MDEGQLKNVSLSRQSVCRLSVVCLSSVCRLSVVCLLSVCMSVCLSVTSSSPIIFRTLCLIGMKFFLQKLEKIFIWEF